MSAAPALLLNVAGPDRVDVVERAGLAVGSGLDGIGLADSPRLFDDPFVAAERVLAATPTAMAGPCVASLGLRHPVTVAGALRTLGRHPERSFAVVGRGESSVRNECLPVPSLREYVRAMRTLQGQLAGGPGPQVLLGAASGPRTIEATAEVLDGVLVDVGVATGTVSRAVEVARSKQHNASVWLFVRAVVTSSPEQAADAAEPLIGSCATRLLAAPEWYGVEPDELAAVRELAASHDYARHGTADARGGARSTADARVRERFLLAGNPDQIAEQVRPWAALGVSGVVLAGGISGVLDRLPELAAALRTGFEGAT